MEFKELFEDNLEEKAKESEYPKLEKKARKALAEIDKNIDVILEIMLSTGEKAGGKVYKTFNTNSGNAWENVNDYINSEFGKE